MDLLAVGGHPDDVELGCGGTVALLSGRYEVGILDLTEGEASSRGSVEERRVETARASEILGVGVRRNARLPDTGVNSESEDQIAALVDILREMKPRVVLAPHWNSVHPDHSETSRMIQRAFVLSRIGGFRTAHSTYRPQGLLFYEARSGMNPNIVVDITPVFDVKMEAIRAHQSQFLRNPDRVHEPETDISDPTFLEGISATARYWGFRSGVRYGEPFLARELLSVGDPLDAFFPPRTD
jgi:bacillithiol biosynthesis deacetylase BshB1